MGEGWPCLTRCAPDQRTQTRQQLGQIERLGQIIVGAGIQPGNLVGARIAGGQDQHRQTIAALAQFLQHGDPVPFGESKIENTGLIGMIEQGQPRRFAITDPIDSMFRQFQSGENAVA